MMRRSDYAPPEWSREESEDTVRALVARMDPDVICLQELPTDPFDILGYEPVTELGRGERGSIGTFVRGANADLVEARPCPHAVLMDVPGLVIANVHLPGGGRADAARLKALEEIRDRAGDAPLVVMGDTNTRKREEEAIGALGLWGKRPAMATRNGRTCRYDEDALGYTAYFTRVFHSEEISLSRQHVMTEPVFDGAHAFHISSHYALFGQIYLEMS